MTGARPFATSTHSLIRRSCSSSLQRRALAGRADRHQPVRALAELPGDVLLKGLVVDRAVRGTG